MSPAEAICTPGAGGWYCRLCLVLSLLVPGLQQMGPTTVASVEVRFSDIGAETITDRVIRQDVMANIASPEEADGAEPTIEVIQQLGLQMASKARRDAIREADQGNFEYARKLMEDAAAKLERLSGGVAAKLRDEINALIEQARQTTKMEYAAQTRKRMSSDAYNISSAKMESLRRARERRKRPPDEDPGEQA